MIKISKNITSFSFQDFVKWCGYKSDSPINISMNLSNLNYISSGRNRRDIYISKHYITRLYAIILLQESFFIGSFSKNVLPKVDMKIISKDTSLEFLERSEKSEEYKIITLDLNDDKFTYFMEDLYNKAKKDWLHNITSFAENGRCGYCQISRPNTLDHFLPKSIYPLLSISSWNLIPCCSECNSSISTKNGNLSDLRLMHPYLIPYSFTNHVVGITKIISDEKLEEKRYSLYFELPSKNRDTKEVYLPLLNSHFNTCKLSQKWNEYSIEEISNLVEIYNTLSSHLNDSSVINFKSLIDYLKVLSFHNIFINRKFAEEILNDFVNFQNYLTMDSDFKCENSVFSGKDQSEFNKMEISIIIKQELNRDLKEYLTWLS